MVEIYTVTVWSFGTFHNTHKVGARGHHRAAPVSRYQSNVWSAKYARGVVRLSVRDAIYSPIYRNKGVSNLGKKDKYLQIVQQTKPFFYDEYLGKQLRVMSSVYSKGASVETVRAMRNENVVEYKTKELPVVREVFSPQISEIKFERIKPSACFSGVKPVAVEFVAPKPIVPRAVVVENYKAAKLQRRERILKIVNSVAAKPVEYKPVLEKKKSVLRKVEKKVTLAKGLGNKRSKVKPFVALKIKTHKSIFVPKYKKTKLVLNKKLNKQKNPVANKIKLERKVVDKNKINNFDLNKLKLPTGVQSEFIVEKVVQKIKDMKLDKKINPKKILDYCVFYAKEKKHMLSKKSFELWRILWAKVESKWAMVIIDDATKMIVSYAVFAKLRCDKIESVLMDAIRDYGAPKAVVNYEQVLFCEDRDCELSPGDKIRGFLQKIGIEYLASIMEESSAYLIAKEFFEYVLTQIKITQKGFEQFVNLYNLRGIRKVGGGTAACFNLES